MRKSSAREERLARALRANLKRRKTAARAKAPPDTQAAPDDGSNRAPDRPNAAKKPD